MKPLRIPAGTKILIGRPAHPLSEDITSAIKQVIAALPGIQECHLSQIFVQGEMEVPTQALVLVIGANLALEGISKSVCIQLTKVLPKETQLDILPMETGNLLLLAVRKTNCQIS